MRKNAAKVGVVGLAVMVWTGGAWAGAVDLRPKFVAGRVTHYRTAAAMMQSATMGDRTTEMSMAREAGIRLAVKQAKPKGGADVEYTMLYVVIDGAMPGMPIKYDSRKPDSASNPMLSGLSAMLDKPVVISTSSDGAIEEVTGAEEITRGLPPAMANMFSEKTLRQEYLSFLPGRKAPHPASVGAKWKDEVRTSLSRNGTMINTIEYTLERVDAKAQTAEIALKTGVRLEAGDNGALPMFSIEDCKGTGRLLWDLKVGELVRIDGDLKLTVKAAGAAAQGNTAPVTQTVKTTLERVTLEDFKLPAKPKSADKPSDN